MADDETVEDVTSETEDVSQEVEDAPEVQETTKATETEKAKPKDSDTTLASDTEEETEDDKKPGYWPDDWRERLAGDDEKTLQKLRRFNGPDGLWKKIQNQEKLLSEREQHVKPPEPDAGEEAWKAYREKAGLPQEPKGYVESLSLSDGKVLGDDDKPLAEQLANIAHEEAIPPEKYSRIVDHFLSLQEERLADQIEADEAFQIESRDMLRDEYGGPQFKTMIKEISMMFPDEETKNDLLLGRTQSGRRIGDDPRMIKMFAEWRMRSPTVTDQVGKETTDRLSEIRKIAREDPDRYERDKALQREHGDLVQKQHELRQRGKAA